MYVGLFIPATSLTCQVEPQSEIMVNGRQDMLVNQPVCMLSEQLQHRPEYSDALSGILGQTTVTSTNIDLRVVGRIVCK